MHRVRLTLFLLPNAICCSLDAFVVIFFFNLETCILSYLSCALRLSSLYWPVEGIADCSLSGSTTTVYLTWLRIEDCCLFF